MDRPILCGREFSKPVTAAFDRIVCLGYYDGPTYGLARCTGNSATYVFDLLAWDAEQENRIYSLAEIAGTVFDSIVEMVRGDTEPNWPFWMPKSKQIPSGELAKVQAQLPAPEYAVATDSLDKTIRNMRMIDGEARTHLPDHGHYPTAEHWLFWHKYVGA